MTLQSTCLEPYKHFTHEIRILSHLDPKVNWWRNLPCPHAWVWLKLKLGFYKRSTPNFGLNFDFDLVISVTQFLRAWALSFFSRWFLLSLVHNYIDFVSYSMRKKLGYNNSSTISCYPISHNFEFWREEQKCLNIKSLTR